MAALKDEDMLAELEDIIRSQPPRDAKHRRFKQRPKTV